MPKSIAKKGFSLVELIVVIAVISLLGILSVASLSELNRRGDISYAINNIESVIENSKQVAQSKGAYVYIAFFADDDKPLQIVAFESTSKSNILNNLVHDSSNMRNLSLPSEDAKFLSKPIAIDNITISDVNAKHDELITRPHSGSSIQEQSLNVKYQGRETSSLVTIRSDGRLKFPEAGSGILEFAIIDTRSEDFTKAAVVQISLPSGTVSTYRVE
ncbi:MAG: prepilin-type N-terminal cleavage/methylation domain-containing protein [Chlamydiota bacterium]